ncbi:MAG: Hsp20/alpha crystallin family protein [Planctomycetota bacterium]
MNCASNDCTPRQTASIFRVLDSVLADPFMAHVAGLSHPQPGTFAVDISEDQGSVIVRSNLPGFAKDQIDVQVHDGLLSIRATRNEEKSQTGERFLRRERRSGAVFRQVELPAEVVDSDAKAEFRDGVLTLRFPKTPKVQPRKLTID